MAPSIPNQRPERSSLKTLVAFVDPAISTNIKRAALDYEATMQNMIEAAAVHFVEELKCGDKAAIATLQRIVSRNVAPGPKPRAREHVAKPA